MIALPIPSVRKEPASGSGNGELPHCRPDEVHKINPVFFQDVVSVKRRKDKGEVIEQISSQQLVPGDVIIIPKHGCMMHVDACLVTGR